MPQSCACRSRKAAPTAAFLFFVGLVADVLGAKRCRGVASTLRRPWPLKMHTAALRAINRAHHEKHPLRIKSSALYRASHSRIAFPVHGPRQMVTAVVIKNTDGVSS